MKILFSYIFLLFIVKEVHLILPEFKRQELLNKLTKKITFENINEYKKIGPNFGLSSSKEGISYDPAKIENLLKEYTFPTDYNFFEDTNATINVKDQANCGCCWSHASTSALAYRYHKKGIEVDLSPQDGLSCYIRDCDAGNYVIDPQLNLIKNGTLTEGCLPFSSSDGKTIESCPTSCKDGSEYKKYYAQNAYTTSDYYDDETFYDIILLIIDQLINNGPVVSAIDVYEDFMYWCFDQQKCHDEVYRYDGISEASGGHAVVIVGYGYLNGKFYWLIQNSWGEDSCDNGFVKIEFGQIEVENIAFSEPYIPTEETPIEIPVTFRSIDEMCDLKVYTSLSKDKWKNTLDITFLHSNGLNTFNYQCGKIDILKNKEIKCYFEYNNYLTSYKGTYNIIEAKSLGTDNNFILDESVNKTFLNFYGLDISIEAYDYFYVISEKGNRITLFYDGGDLNSVIPPIYPNSDIDTPLSDCKRINDLNYIYCDIKKDELKYFKYITDMEDDDNSLLVYDLLCGYKYPIAFIYKTDIRGMATFNIISFIIPEGNRISSTSPLQIIVNAEGYIEPYKRYDNSFIIFVNVENINNNKNDTGILVCNIEIASNNKNNLAFQCRILIESGKYVKFDNLYLLPYYMPSEMNYYYEIYIKEEIKGTTSKYDPIEPSDDSFSSYTKFSILLIIALFLLF